MSKIKPLTLVEFLYEHKSTQPLPDALAQLHGALYNVKALTLSGVYFLLHEEEVVYVGQSTNVAQRVATGHPDKEFDEAFMLLVPEEQLLEVETAFIAALNPIYNQTALPKGSYKNARTLRILDSFGWEID